MKKILKAQITTILVFIAAVLFLFSLITMNITRVAQKKTTISNIADSVGLRLASQLGSMSNALKKEYEIYGDKLEKEDVNWQIIWGGICLIAGIIVSVLIIVGTVGAGTPAVAFLWAVTASSLLVGGASGLYFGVSQQIAVGNLALQDQLKLKFKSLTGLQQVIETPVYGVLIGLVDDPALVKDDFDADRDKDKTDYIPRFSKWYINRLNSFGAIGPVYDAFYKAFFGKNRFYIRENNNKMAMVREKGDDPQRPDSEGYWVDWQVDGLKLVPWLNGNLRSMLSEMRPYGYGLNGQEDKKVITISDGGWTTYEEMIKVWVSEIEEFENAIARGFYDMDRDSAIMGLESWIDFIMYERPGSGKICGEKVNEKDDDYKDWYTRLGILKDNALDLKANLEIRKQEIHNCIAGCMTITYQCCSCCALWEPMEKRAYLLAYNRAGSGSMLDCGGGLIPYRSKTLILAEDGGGNGGGGNGGGGEDGGEKCSPSYGCCGPEVGCGQFCNECGSSVSCDTHTPVGKTNCCSVLPLEPYCSNNIVDRYGVIAILDRFVADIEEIRNIMKTFYNEAKAIDDVSYEKMHEAFYLWKDYVGGASSAQKQEVGHISYARFDIKKVRVDDKEIPVQPDCFRLPTIRQGSKWEWDWLGKDIGLPPIFPFVAYLPKTYAKVRNATGEFTLTVARFDEDTAKEGPVSRFWTFRFGKAGSSKEQKEQDEAFVRAKAGQLLGPKANAASYIEFSESDKARLRSILNNYGITSTVRVHYGPGYTYKEGETVDPKKKNKDIYIKKACSSMECD